MKMTKKDHQVAFRRVMGLVCIYETAEMLGVSRQTLYRWQDAGKMPERIVKGSGTRTYYRLADILALTATRNGPLQEAGSE